LQEALPPSILCKESDAQRDEYIISSFEAEEEDRFSLVE
jgi:hypothetical protein